MIKGVGGYDMIEPCVYIQGELQQGRMWTLNNTEAASPYP